MTDNTLTEEFRVYDANIAEWVKTRSGQFVVIHEAEVLGFYPSYEKALSAGYERFGVAPFFVKLVGSPTDAHHISRLVAPTPVA